MFSKIGALSAINTMFSCKKIFTSAKSQKEPPQVFCLKRPATLLEKGSNIAKVYKNTRSSHLRCSVIKGVFIIFAIFTGKHLCQSLFLNIVAGLRSATLLRKRLWHRFFPVNFAKFIRTPFLQNTSGGCF